MGIFFDLPNFFIVVIILIFLAIKTKLQKKYILLLLLSAFSPFLLNGVIFTADYMPDQYRYWLMVQDIRSGNIFHDINLFNGYIEAIKNSSRDSVEQASYFLSIIPIPFHETIRSLGFANKAMYIAIVFFLYGNRFFNKETLLFFILYPSMILYTGLSLRDTLILALMILSLYFMTKNKLLLSLLLIAPLYTIKIQNFFICIIFIFIYFIFKVNNNGLTPKKFIATTIYFIFIYIASAPLAIPLLNFYRKAMWAEDGNNVNDINNIDSFSQFILEGTNSGIYFILKPFPWEAEGVFQLTQSFENIMVFTFIVWITQKCLKHDKNRALFWILFLLAASTIYGLVVANYGTAARYRFPFIATYVIFIVYDTFYSPYAKKPIESSRTYWKNKLFDHEKSTLPSQR